MIRVFIVDDEQEGISSLRNKLTTFFEEVEICGTATNVSEAYAAICQQKPQLVFLDIEMGKESGFQLLERFEEVDFHVVFVTAHEEYALRAIKFSALDYIIKPAGEDELEELLRKVSRQKGHYHENLKIQEMFGNFLTADKSEHRITVSMSDGYEFIKVADLLYITAEGSYSRLHLRSGKSIVASKNLKFFEGALQSYGFFRIHNSTVINIKYIKRISKAAGGVVTMENDEDFHIAKGRRADFFDLMTIR